MTVGISRLVYLLIAAGSLGGGRAADLEGLRQQRCHSRSPTCKQSIKSISEQKSNMRSHYVMPRDHCAAGNDDM